MNDYLNIFNTMWFSESSIICIYNKITLRYGVDIKELNGKYYQKTFPANYLEPASTKDSILISLFMALKYGNQAFECDLIGLQA